MSTLDNQHINTDNGSTESRLVRVRTFWTGSVCRFLRCCARRRIRRGEHDNRACQAAANAREGSGSNQGSLASETSLVNVKVILIFVTFVTG